MPDLLEHMYCSQQINIPPNLPFILKQYAKAAIRTQPYDLLSWSAAYFRAKANNTSPPVKERLEYPPFDSPSRLSPGFLKVLHKQLGENTYVLEDILYEKWFGVCLVKEALHSMLKVGGMVGKIPWLRFIAIASGHLCPNLKNTMIMVCNILTEEPDGGSAMIPVSIFVDLYQFLARLDCGPEPPDAKKTAETTTTSSITAVSTQSLTSADDQPIESGAETEKTERDSTAGLMVWDDLKPQEKRLPMQSPKYRDEQGASSELGIEVLDDAKGPVTELVTLYSAKSHLKSELSTTSSVPKSGHVSTFDETILSHSSLKGNEDWIKLESTKTKEEMYKKKMSVLSSLTSDTDLSILDPEKDKTTVDGNEDEPKYNQQNSNLDLKESEQYLENIELMEVSTAQSTGDDEVEETIIRNDFYQDNHVTEGRSSDSIIEPGETVTVQRFAKDNFERGTAYSTAEIRKGYFGDKSEEKIERASSENTIRAAQTVQKLEVIEDESAVLKFQEQLVDIPTEIESKSSKEESHGSSGSSEKSVSWQHVPGIGPVIPEPQILAVVEYMEYWANKQQGMVMPRNINHILCPPLDLSLPTEEHENQSHY